LGSVCIHRYRSRTVLNGITAISCPFSDIQLTLFLLPGLFGTGFDGGRLFTLTTCTRTFLMSGGGLCFFLPLRRFCNLFSSFLIIVFYLFAVMIYFTAWRSVFFSKLPPPRPLFFYWLCKRFRWSNHSLNTSATNDQ